MKYQLLVGAFATLAVVCGRAVIADAGDAADEKRANILFLFSDDQRADTIGAWGNELTSDTPQPKQIDLTGRKRKPDRWQPQWIVDKYYFHDSRR